MKKAEWAALVNTLRRALDEREGQIHRAEQEAQRERASAHSLAQQVRALEQRLAAPPPPAPLRGYPDAMRFINSGSVYRPASEDESPDIWVIDAYVADAPRVPFVKIH